MNYKKNLKIEQRIEYAKRDIEKVLEEYNVGLIPVFNYTEAGAMVSLQMIDKAKKSEIVTL